MSKVYHRAQLIDCQYKSCRVLIQLLISVAKRVEAEVREEDSWTLKEKKEV